MGIKITVFWDLVQCKLVHMRQRCGEYYCVILMN